MQLMNGGDGVGWVGSGEGVKRGKMVYTTNQTQLAAQ